MATRRIRDFLAGNKIPHKTINHTCAFTAKEVAESSHVPGRYLAKSVIVRVDGRVTIMAIAATRRLDLEKVCRQTGAKDVRLLDEDEFRNLFEGCQTGAVPPFGNLFGVDTCVDWHLTYQSSIAFSAGTHTDVFIMGYADFARLVHPRVMDLAAEELGQEVRAAGQTNGRKFSVDSLLEDESLVQADCGCTILHHAGAD